MRAMPRPINFVFFLILGFASSQLFPMYRNSSSQPEQFDREPETESDFEDCRMDAREQPWLGYLRISNSTHAETESDVYWPVVVIGPTTVFTGVRAFRSLYYDRKLNIHNLTMYHVHLKDGMRRSVSSIQLNPGFAPRGEMCANWMTVENDVALVHLNERIDFSRAVRRLCLPSWSQEWWNTVQANRESFLETGSITYISGWRGTYDNALQKKDVCLQLRLNKSEECRREWKACWEYAEEEDIGDVKNVNRVCGAQIGKAVAQDRQRQDFRLQVVDEDHGLFAGFFYFHIHIGGEGDLILSGVLDGISHLTNGRTGPTAFVRMLPPSRVEWINASMKCGPGNFTCDEGECIDWEAVCDEQSDCEDGSDENYTFCRGLRHCKSNEYECGAYGECVDVAKVKVCDGTWDCSNGADEDDCPTIPVRTKTMHVWVSVILAVLAAGFFLGTIAVVRHLIQKGKERFYLTAVEVGHFLNGVGSSTGSDISPMHAVMRVYENIAPIIADVAAGQPRPLNLMQMPFIHDIPRAHVELHEQIGTGAFGVVYRATYDGQTCAGKVLNPELVDKPMFKTFLAELKIMDYVKFKHGHENVVRLIGACIEEIRNFELLVVIEYCEHGSISDYLRTNRARLEEACHPRNWNSRTSQNPPPRFAIAVSENLDFTFTGTFNCRYISAISLQTSIGIHRLRSWALQIAEGMRFLESIGIIHGDLSARNVLLDSDLNAKISDFGLSRQLYYYNISCTKVRKNMPVPWRWMAPEVLESMNISSKADVWSFGVTIWEIYTLGNVPYGGGLELNPYFVRQLQSGLRPLRPKYADDSIFGILQQCWKYDRRQRPDFRALRDTLAAA